MCCPSQGKLEFPKRKPTSGAEIARKMRELSELERRVRMLKLELSHATAMIKMCKTLQ